MDNSKSAKICAYLSLAISVVLMVLWSCNVGGFETVNLDTFVGVIVALLAIIVTLAVAWQIYNAVEMKNKVEELKRLEDKIKEHEKSIVQSKLSVSHMISMLMGIAAEKDKALLPAFRFILHSLESSMKLETPMNIEPVFLKMSIINRRITATEIDYDVNQINNIKALNDSIRSLPNYELIKGQYEPLYDEFITKVDKAEKQK